MSISDDESEDEETKMRRLAEERRKKRAEMLAALAASESQPTAQPQNAVIGSEPKTAQATQEPTKVSNPPLTSTSISAKPAPSSASLAVVASQRAPSIVSSIPSILEKVVGATVVEDMFSETLESHGDAKQTTCAISMSDTGVGRNITPSQQVDAQIADREGYILFKPGSVLGERYVIRGVRGRGMFASVLFAEDTQCGGKPCVIKVIRDNEVLRKAGLKEIEVLEQLRDAAKRQGAEPEQRFTIGLEGHFEHKGHLCLVFPPMPLNLRELLRGLGGVGFSLPAVRKCAYQFFVALAHFRRCNIMHGDLKPDNILTDQDLSTIRICDFGTAVVTTDRADFQFSEYAASRYYRAPEVILGMEYDEMSDVWSIGVVLFELFTGQVLFKGESNNEMLKLMMEIKGGMKRRMIRAGRVAHKHFDLETGAFLETRIDKVTGELLRYAVNVPREPTRDLKRLVQRSGTIGRDEEPLLLHFVDLLHKCLELDPLHRIQPADALRHPFITSAFGQKLEAK